MWKYQCKRHLLSLLIGAAVGVILFATTMDSSAIQEMRQMYPSIPAEYIQMAYDMRYLTGALIGASTLNGIMLLIMLVQKLNFSPFMLMILIFFLPIFGILLAIGLILLIPTIVVCIYGMLTIRNAAAKNFKTLPSGDGKEVERVYRLHHAYRDDVVPLALKCRKDSDKWTIVYALGLAALMCMLIVVHNMALSMIAFVIYGFIFLYVLRLRAQSVIPINDLLYNQCDPEACATAILAFSRRGNRLNLKLQLLFAQCMLYLNDPQLAMDSLVLMRRNGGAGELSYQSLMANANYQLGDRSALQVNLEACKTVKINGMGPTGSMMRQESVDSIQNKLNLMDERFDLCIAHYQQLLPRMMLNFQLVDAHYYLGMIAFVQKDFAAAEEHFRFVSARGNKMFYKEKADRYLALIERMNNAAKTEETDG